MGNAHIFGNAFCRKYMGPPSYPLKVFRTRNFRPKKISAYLTIAPRKETTHTQNKAPGPPILMAIATVARFPIPIQPPRDAKKTFKEEVPKWSCLGNRQDVKKYRKILGNSQTTINFDLTVKYKIEDKIRKRPIYPHKISLLK